MERGPAGHRAGHSDRVDTAVGQFALDALALEEFDRHPLRRPAARVQAVKLVLFGEVDDGEEIAADPVGGRLHQALSRIGGDRGIDGIAPAKHDLHGSLGGERLAGRGHPVRRSRHRPARNWKCCRQGHRKRHHAAIL